MSNSRLPHDDNNNDNKPQKNVALRGDGTEPHQVIQDMHASARNAQTLDAQLQALREDLKGLKATQNEKNNINKAGRLLTGAAGFVLGATAAGITAMENNRYNSQSRIPAPHMRVMPRENGIRGLFGLPQNQAGPTAPFNQREAILTPINLHNMMEDKDWGRTMHEQGETQRENIALHWRNYLGQIDAMSISFKENYKTDTLELELLEQNQTLQIENMGTRWADLMAQGNTNIVATEMQAAAWAMDKIILADAVQPNNHNEAMLNFTENMRMVGDGIKHLLDKRRGNAQGR